MIFLEHSIIYRNSRIYRNTTTVLPSVCNAKKKAQKIVSKFSKKTPNFFDEWKAYLEINFFSFSLISD